LLRRVRWTPATIARAALCLGFLTLQVVVPTVLLFGPRPARFGWQMFAAHTTAPAFATAHADGRRTLVDVDDYFAFRRGDLDPAVFDRLPAHICRLDPSVVTVYERCTAEAQIEAHPCR
jgi:hypothetical protein